MGPSIRTWLEVKWTVDDGWSGLSMEDGWVKLDGPPISTLIRETG